MNASTTIPPAECRQVADRFRAAVATLPCRRDTDLRRLWLAAADADDAVQEHLRSTLPAWGREDREFVRLQDAAADAEEALRDHLLSVHGLTSADLRRSVL